MKQGQDEFFAVIGEGAALLQSLDEQSSGFFDDLNRLREILAMLGDAPAVGPLKYSLADKAGSLAALSEYLKRGMSALPGELAPFEVQTMSDLTLLAGGDTGPLSEELWEYQNKLGMAAGDPEARRAAYKFIAGRGLQHGIEQAELDKMEADAAAHLAKRPEDSSEYVAAKAEYQRVTKERTEGFNRITAALHRAVAADEDTAALFAEREELMRRTEEEQTAAYQRYTELHDAYNRDRVDGYKAIFEAHGTTIINKLAEASPVTQEQADAWAAEQVIDANARAKLKKMGYAPEDVVRDMAEFFRLSGGKASAIRIGLDGGKRANAVGVTARLGEKVINLGSRFNKTVLFHEMAHFLENDPIAKGASNGFLLERREGEGVYSLRDLTGNKGYDAREVAYKDHFMDAYVGKYYRDGVTEVFSMGVQYLANPKDAANFAAKDPEMFALITGYLTSTLTPAMQAKLDMHKGAVGEAMEKRQSQDELYERAVAYFAAQVPLAKDDWFDALDKTDGPYRDLQWNVLSQCKKGVPEYVGSFGNYRVFSGLVRNAVTKRNAKGHIVVDLNKLFYAVVLTGDLDDARAMIAVTEKNGVNLSDTRYGYFLEGWAKDRKQKLIDLAGMENLE